MTFPNHMTLVLRDGTWLATCLRCGYRVDNPDLQRLKLEMQKHACREEREVGNAATPGDEA
ncbi:MAG: hypothetical protein ACRD3E_14200 [Terriglobales bacterium]